MSDFLRPHGLQHARPPCPSPIPSSLKLMSIESVMPSNHLILWRPLLLLPSIFPSIRVFSNESALCIRWPQYWSFSFSISPSSEHPGLISFRMDWLDLLAVQGLSRVFCNTTVHHTWLILYWIYCVSTEFLFSWGTKRMNFAVSHGLWQIGDSYSVCVNWEKERMNCVMSYPCKSNFSTKLSKIHHGMGCHFHG